MFMQDETQIIEKEPKQVVETQTTTTSTVVGQPPLPPDESHVWGASGRFWIAFMLGLGLILLPVLYLAVIVVGYTVDAAVFKDIFFAYIGVAAVAVGTYVGQKAPSRKVG
jgi:hypothetical protein